MPAAWSPATRSGSSRPWTNIAASEQRAYRLGLKMSVVGWVRDHFFFFISPPPLLSAVSVSGQLNVAYTGNLTTIAPAANRVLAFPVGLTGGTFSDKLLILNH